MELDKLSDDAKAILQEAIERLIAGDFDEVDLSDPPEGWGGLTVAHDGIGEI